VIMLAVIQARNFCRLVCCKKLKIRIYKTIILPVAHMPNTYLLVFLNVNMTLVLPYIILQIFVHNNSCCIKREIVCPIANCFNKI
jgi:hypothetical protein